jgi:hypothetical protein
MELFTEKERCCLVCYTCDLLQLMVDDGVNTIADDQGEYTRDEIEVLIRKLTAK